MSAKTDRELLELAAKACGMPYWEHYDESNAALIVPAAEDGVAEEWNPLADDGDALRLAVKLGIDVEQSNGFAIARRPFDGNDTPRGRSNRATCIDYGSDLYTATRRAIVRAAAVIGETL